ncbi:MULTISPECIES: AAA family ATPase [unclassified Microcoleus]|uniref:AAA family ATPase n=1 Tax=unclassified Microcoleus TaxID=2642155 RepID=UPI002FD05E01
MVYSQSFPQQIDREQVRQQLAALGYKAGDTVYLRAFYPSSDPRKAGDAGRKAEATNLDQLIERATEFQTEGRGVYLVVNGGGHTDKDVTETRAVFYEHDNLDKAAQIDLWKDLGLPEPTLQIDTGGKSIHSYWVFDEFVAVEKWRLLQTELLEEADADRSLKNPSRVMRLAGARHSSGNQSLIVSNSGMRYTYEDLRAIVPTPEKPEPTLFRDQSTVKPLAAGDIPDTYEDIAVPVPASVPLEECLAKSSRELLYGISEGGRNEAGAKLARDLIGTANYLRAIGQAFNGDPQQMLEDFAARCNPPLPKHEAETIWKSALQGSPTPACKPDGVKNCIKGWYWNNHIKTSRRFVDRQTDKPTHKNKLGMREAAQMAREILKGEPNEVSANIKLEEVRQKTSFSEYAWEHKIIKPLKRDMDAERFKLELLGLLQMEDPVERIRQIALLAPKYSMSAGSLKEAMAAMKQRTSASESRLWSLNEVFSLQSEGLRWVVPELLPRGETVILSASPKCGKSLIAVDLAFCTATGEEKFLGQNIEVGKVLLVSVDESLNSTRSKLLKRGFRLTESDNLKVLPQWDITQTAKLEAFLEDYRPDVVIIDSLKRICKGSAVSENSAEFSDNIYALKELLTRYDAAGVLIHHSNKNHEALGVERLRGSSAIAGSVWGVWQVDHIPKQDPHNKKKMIVDPKCPKRIFSCFPRDAEGQTLDIELNLENNSWLCHGLAGEDAEATQQRGTIRERILRTLEKHNRPLPGPEIIELALLAEQRGSAYSELNRMVGKKVISAAPAPGDKRYTLYSLPNCHAESLSVKSPPPPPPPISLPIAIYNSVNHTEHGLQIDSQIDSTYIAIDSTVTVQSEVLSTANHCEEKVSEIDSNFSLSQGRGGVKQNLEPDSVTVSTAELAQEQEPRSTVDTNQSTVEPLARTEIEVSTCGTGAKTGAGDVEIGAGDDETGAVEVKVPIAPSLQFTPGDRVKVSVQYPGTQEFRGKLATIVDVYNDGRCRIEFDSEIEISGCQPTKATSINGDYLVLESAASLLNEDELELVEEMLLAISQSDELVTDAVKKSLAETCDKGLASREKVWFALTASERTAFRALLAAVTNPI